MKMIPVIVRIVFAFLPVVAGAANYDPLKVPDERPAAPADFIVHDVKRDLDIPLRVFLPAGKGDGRSRLGS
ncbi:MAG: hypothetical protein ABI318_14660 [Chthoniobacteraceae bacterium]